MSGSLPLIKLGAQLVAGLGVTKIVSGIVKNNVPIVTTAEKVMVNAGSFVLGSMLVQQSSKHVEETINEAVSWFEKAKKTENTSEQ